jgi:hypothetical protein
MKKKTVKKLIVCEQLWGATMGSKPQGWLSTASNIAAFLLWFGKE